MNGLTHDELFLSCKKFKIPQQVKDNSNNIKNGLRLRIDS